MRLEENLDGYVPGIVIVRFRPEASEENILAIVNQYQGQELFKGINVDEELLSQVGLDRTYKLRVEKGKEQETIGELYASGYVEYVGQDAWRTINAPNVPLFGHSKKYMAEILKYRKNCKY